MELVQDAAQLTNKSALPGNSVMSPALWEQWQMRKHQGKTIGEISQVTRAAVPASAPEGKQNSKLGNGYGLNQQKK